MLMLLVLLIVLVPVGNAYAAPSQDRVIGAGETVEEDVVIFGGTLLLEEGATVNGDVAIFGGVATLAGHVDGDVAIFGGTTDFSGTVDGDLVILGGNLEASTKANVDGDCVLIGGSLSGDGQDAINCSTVGDFPGFAIPAIVDQPSIPSPPSVPSPPSPPHVERLPRFSFFSGLFGTIAEVAGRSLILGLLALVIAAVAPNQLNQVRSTMTRKPAASSAVGVLTAIAVPSLAVLLLILSAVLTIVCIGLLGFPIVFVLLIALAVGVVLGWVAVGTWLGERLAGWFKLSNQSLMVTAALGTVILTVIAGLLGALPFLLGGWLWTLGAILIASAGLGAVALTRFGTRPYPLEASDNDQKVADVLETLTVEDEGATAGK
jgi:hypothetical protein